MRTATIALGLFALGALSGCLGAGSGGSLGSSSAGVQALGGGLLAKSRNASSLSDDARGQAVMAEFQALQFGPAGQPVTWSSDGVSGEVVPTQLYRIGSQDCRGYSHTFRAGGQAVKETGTACKSGDGNWTLVG